jgi:hypothetical protein
MLASLNEQYIIDNLPIRIVPYEHLPVIQKRVEKLVRKARKLNVEPLQLVVSEPYTVGTKDLIEVVRVEVVGAAPVLPGGWTFQATVESSGIIRKMPGVGEVPDRFRSSFVCEHCGKVRRRNETFILKNDQGSYVQVGRQCLKDFLGYHEVLLYVSDYVSEVLGECERYGSYEYVYDLKHYLRYCCAAYRFQKGYVSRRENWVESTAGVAWYSLQPSKNNPLKEPILPDETDDLFADQVLWETVIRLYNLDRLSDYEHNLKTLILMGYVRRKHAGIAASMLSSYGYRKVETRTSEFVGVVGKRDRFEVTLTGRIAFDSAYGNLWLYKFEDAAGNALVWWTSAGLADVHEGDRLTVVGMVKEHKLYNNIKQTVLTRVKAI